MCVAANPEGPRRALRNLGQRAAAARNAQASVPHRETKGEPSRQAFHCTDRRGSLGRSGGHGWGCCTKPSCKRDRGWSSLARDVLPKYQSRQRLTRGISHCNIQIVTKNQKLKNRFQQAESTATFCGRNVLRRGTKTRSCRNRGTNVDAHKPEYIDHFTAIRFLGAKSPLSRRSEIISIPLLRDWSPARLSRPMRLILDT